MYLHRKLKRKLFLLLKKPWFKQHSMSVCARIPPLPEVLYIVLKLKKCLSLFPDDSCGGGAQSTGAPGAGTRPGRTRAQKLKKQPAVAIQETGAQ